MTTSEGRIIQLRETAHLIPIGKTESADLLALAGELLSLHSIQHLWTHPEYVGSYDSIEDMIELAPDDPGYAEELALLGSLHVCVECARIEREAVAECSSGCLEDHVYKNSLWPCKTRQMVSQVLCTDDSHLSCPVCSTTEGTATT